MLRVRRHPEILAILYLDLDQFKSVNDTLGHPAGDKLLVAVAERLRACLRDSDMVARFGGDEFAVLQIGLAGAHEAGDLAERIVTLLSEPYDIEGQQSVIGASVGIALAPDDGDSTEQLLRNADMALYQAKEEAGASSAFSSPAWTPAFEPAARWSSICATRSRLANSSSIISLSSSLETGVISGFEALLRWHHPLRGMVAAGRVHSACRGDRPDCPAWRMGAASSLRRGGGMAATI